MESNARIRDAKDGDVAALREVFVRASLSNSGDRQSLIENPSALEWDEELLRTAQVRVLVAEDSEVLGFATTSVEGTLGELVDLFVDPEARFRGYGKELVRDALRIAARAGCQTLEVTANFHAMEFYTAVGFIRGELVETQFGAGVRMAMSTDCRVSRN